MSYMHVDLVYALIGNQSIMIGQVILISHGSLFLKEDISQKKQRLNKIDSCFTEEKRFHLFPINVSTFIIIPISTV
ncbi:hypothetical protein ACJX0J_008985, partial [Zea mays]